MLTFSTPPDTIGPRFLKQRSRNDHRQKRVYRYLWRRGARFGSGRGARAKFTTDYPTVSGGAAMVCLPRNPSRWRLCGALSCAGRGCPPSEVRLRATHRPALPAPESREARTFVWFTHVNLKPKV